MLNYCCCYLSRCTI